MKLSKSTIILLNLIFILLIALLVKLLIYFPDNIYASAVIQYKTIDANSSAGYEEIVFNELAKEGWKYHSVVAKGNRYLFEK